MTATRRLAAMLAADVAGYSRLMGADEESTLERLKALRRELLDPKITEHHGRIVKTTGDGMLVEFPSVVDAVRCAVAVQQAMPERNAGVAADTRIELRIMRPASRSAKFSALIEEVRFAADSPLEGGDSNSRSPVYGELGATQVRKKSPACLGAEEFICCQGEHGSKGAKRYIIGVSAPSASAGFGRVGRWSSFSQAMPA
jgi:hypothetical protein